MTTLDDWLWTDPICMYLRKRRQRLWQLLCDMERLRQRWGSARVDTWIPGVWAANLNTGKRQFEKDITQLRSLGLMHPDRIEVQPAQPVESERRAPRPVYPSDQRRNANGKNGHSADTPQVGIAESETTPHGAGNHSATTPQAAPSHAHARTEPDRSGSDRLFINKPDSGPEPNRTDARDSAKHSAPTPQNTPHPHLVVEADIVQEIRRISDISEGRAKILVQSLGVSKMREVLTMVRERKPERPGAVIEDALKKPQKYGIVFAGDRAVVRGAETVPRPVNPEANAWAAGLMRKFGLEPEEEGG